MYVLDEGSIVAENHWRAQHDVSLKEINPNIIFTNEFVLPENIQIKINEYIEKYANNEYYNCTKFHQSIQLSDIFTKKKSNY